MSTRFYNTDLTDTAWTWVAPVLPAARPGGRPRTTDPRGVVNAIFYLLRTGCQWRLLPREFPPWGTVYHYFQAWQNSGVCQRSGGQFSVLPTLVCDFGSQGCRFEPCRVQIKSQSPSSGDLTPRKTDLLKTCLPFFVSIICIGLSR
jgi:hypothetical protein